MTDRKMLIIVPTRSRPQNVAKVIRAWEETGAFEDGAELCFAIDRDDPKLGLYDLAMADRSNRPGVTKTLHIEWHPMVHKLNTAARWMIHHRTPPFVIGFAGDDHLPRTRGWAGRYLMALAELGTGIVSCPDGYRRDDLPTQWAMTADIVRTLGRMVPAPVEHLYCDNAVRDLAKAADCWRWLDDVLIEHVHPLAGKTDWDGQYQHVNRKAQFATDRAAYGEWYRERLNIDAAEIRALAASSTAPYRPAGEGQ